MPLQDYMHIISVDDHLIEHPRVWTDRLPQKYTENGPQIIEDEQGHHIWKFDGNLFPYIGLNAVAGKKFEEFGMDPVRFEDMIPGCYDPVARVKDMDIDGVQAAACFPSFPGFGGNVFHRAKDKELALACVKAWNDFSIDEWCGSAPGRYIPLAILPTWDLDIMLAEAKRTAAKGARTFTFPDAPTNLGMPSFHNPVYDPFWSFLEEAHIPLSLHFGSGGFVPGFEYAVSALREQPLTQADQPPFAVAIASFATNLMWTTLDWVFSGQLQKHPDLRIMLSEGGIGWLPYITERAEETWMRHRWYQDIDKNANPRDLIRQHFYGCFISDFHGVKNRHEIGIDRITVEVDYPHSDSNWPNSRKVLAEQFHEVPDDEVHRIVELNAREAFNFPRQEA